MKNLLKKKVVLIIIGVVAVMLLVSLPGLLGGPGKARDKQRKADLTEIQTAVEAYFKDNNTYPNSEWVAALSLGSTPYLTEIPTDPLTAENYTYTPGPNGCSSACTSYTISAQMEKERGKNAPNGVYSVTSKPYAKK